MVATETAAILGAADLIKGRVSVVTFRAADFNQIHHILMVKKLQNLDLAQGSDWELKHTHVYIHISHLHIWM